MLLLTLAFAFVGVASACLARPGQETTALSADQWRKDLAFFAAELPRRHKNAFHNIAREDFTAAVSKLDTRIPKLEGHEVAVEMLRITALVGDLHTRLQLPASFRRYPIQLEWFEDELRITGSTEPYHAALGARVLAIGGVSIEEVQRRVRPLTPQAENEWTFRAVSPSYLLRPEILHALAIIPQPGPTELTLMLGSGEQTTMTIAPVAVNPSPKMVTLEPTPLYRQRPDESLWFTWLADQQTVYVNFRNYDDFAPKARQLLAFIDAHPTQRVIIDMRNNTGGDFTKVREQLLPGLKKRNGAFDGGNLFVIIGRRTFSAAMTNAIDLKTQLGGTLVGEPTGERPNSYQEGREVRLPNSGLRLTYSIKFYRFLDKDEPALKPDRSVRYTWAAYSAGQDPALDLILSQPRSGSRSVCAESTRAARTCDRQASRPGMGRAHRAT